MVQAFFGSESESNVGFHTKDVGILLLLALYGVFDLDDFDCSHKDMIYKQSNNTSI